MSRALTAKKIIVEIIRQAGSSLAGTTRVYKAFYLAHLYFADREPGYLSDWPIVCMPNGPGIDEGDELLHELVVAGVLRTEQQPVGPYTATVYKLTGKELPGDPLPEAAVAAIREAAGFVKGHTAAQLSDLTHEYSRSWKKAENGSEMNVYVDLIPDEEFQERKRQLELLRHEVAQAVRARESA